MQIIGLTGRIGSGKSTAAEFFKELGYQIISADIIAKEILQESEVIDELVLAFGKQIKDGEKINSTSLAKQAFQNKKSVQAINSITHPKIRAKSLVTLDKIYQQNPSARVIYDAPLLIEVNAHSKMQKTILVKTDLKIIIERILQRSKGRKNKISISDLKKRMYYQIDPDEANKLVDFVINGSVGLAEVKQQVVIIAKQLATIPQLTLAQIKAI